MKEKERLILLEVQYYRAQFKYDEALVLLHQLIIKYPNNDVYHFLVSALYFEINEIEPALEYCEKALELNSLSNEALELRGLIYIKEENFDAAKKEFIKILDNNIDYFQAHMHLISLYHDSLEDYENTIKHCEFLLTNRDIDRNNYTKKQKQKILEWLLPVNSYLLSSLIKTKEYHEALLLIENDIHFREKIVDNYQGYFLHEEINIYKLCFLLNNPEKTKYWENYLIDKYNVDKNFIPNIIKEATEYKFSL